MIRSWMFIPGSHDKHLQKAQSLDSDVLIFDLEDAVAENEKKVARQKIIPFLKNQQHKKCYVRVNSLESPHFMKDIKDIICLELDGIILPKASCTEDIIITDYLLKQMEMESNIPKGKTKIVPLIENGIGIHNSYTIAVASERIMCLAFGAEDFTLDLTINTTENESELQYARAKLVEVSGAAGIEAPIDTVYTSIQNQKGLQKSAYNSKNLGFQGKLAIHPEQLKIINTVYSYSTEQIEEAKTIVSAYNKSIAQGKGAIEYNGKMIDMPVAEKAKNILKKLKD